MDFVYDGKCSKDFGIIVKNVKRHNAPSRDIETISIPGRDGNLYIDNGSYGIRKIEIETYIKNDVARNAELINEWLYKSFAIRKLHFTDEQCYYEGICINAIDFAQVYRYFDIAKIVFECKPYKKLFEGDRTVKLTSPKTIVNPGCNSRPYIKITGSGDISLSINDKTYMFKDVDGFIEIDSESMDCYKTYQGVIVHQNNKMYTASFPILYCGENNLSWTGTVSKLEIIPRWCML